MSWKKGFLLIVLLMAGCATPPQVKQLSIKQNEYFDAAIAAVSIQSEALILATEKLVEQSKQRIANEEEANRERFEKLMQASAQSADNAREIANRLSATANEAAMSREKLDHDLESIKNKTLELGRFLEKMKQVNITLDAYIQSEKAGEVVLNDIMNQPTVSALLNSVSDLTPKIQKSVNEINSLLNEIK